MGTSLPIGAKTHTAVVAKRSDITGFGPVAVVACVDSVRLLQSAPGGMMSDVT
jgi:hypothetical protein